MERMRVCASDKCTNVRVCASHMCTCVCVNLTCVFVLVRCTTLRRTICQMPRDCTCQVSHRTHTNTCAFDKPKHVWQIQTRVCASNTFVFVHLTYSCLCIWDFCASHQKKRNNKKILEHIRVCASDIFMFVHLTFLCISHMEKHYGVAMISRLLTIWCLYCRISSLL